MSRELSPPQSSRFQPLPRQSLAMLVADQIRQAIVTGDINSSEDITEAKIGKQFGVSRGPVREALLALQRDGLIETIDSGRRRVQKLTLEDFEELLEMRIVLESRTCFRVATSITDETVARLEAIIAEQAACNVLLELSLLDIDFHSVIAEAAGNRRLLDAWLRIKSQLELWLVQMQIHHQAVTKQTFRITVESHKKLVRALRGGDPEIAEKTIRTDLHAWGQLIRNAFHAS